MSVVKLETLGADEDQAPKQELDALSLGSEAGAVRVGARRF